MKKTQTDKGLTFDGAELISAPKVNKFQGNQHAGVQNANKTVNYGRGATKGNTGSTANAGPKRPPVVTPGSTDAAKKAFGAGTFNAGAQVRTPGGTRTWEPSAGQNYKGNIDRISEGRGPTKGNQQ